MRYNEHFFNPGDMFCWILFIPGFPSGPLIAFREHFRIFRTWMESMKGIEWKVPSFDDQISRNWNKIQRTTSKEQRCSLCKPTLSRSALCFTPGKPTCIVRCGPTLWFPCSNGGGRKQNVKNPRLRRDAFWGQSLPWWTRSLPAVGAGFGLCLRSACCGPASEREGRWTMDFF